MENKEINNNPHPIEGLMKSTMENIKQMVDVNTIVGDSVNSNGSVIIPISRVSFGFTSGGSEYDTKTSIKDSEDYPFGGLSGAGVSIKPVGFLVMKDDAIRFLSADHETSYDRIIDNIPQYIDSVKGFIKKDDSSDKNLN